MRLTAPSLSLMREAYAEQLAALSDQLAGMCELVADSMHRATTSLLTADLALAEQVIGDEVKIDELLGNCEQTAVGLLALQAPVAGDLRIVVSAIRAGGDIERMSQLSLHVAQTARRRHPQKVLPEQVAPFFAEMGRVAVELATAAAGIIRTRNIELANKLDEDDDAMDDLHRHLFTKLMTPGWPHGVTTAVDITLLGRFYERYADHAVSLGRQVVFVVTGQMPAEAGT
jgi:phosphate transport system protein